MHVTEAVRANVRRGRLLLRAPERWQSGRMRRFAKPLYGLIPVPRVRIPPSPPDPYFLLFAARLAWGRSSFGKSHDLFKQLLEHLRLMATPVTILRKHCSTVRDTQNRHR